MQEFVEECVKSYCKLTGTERSKLRRVPSPFIDETKDYDPMFDCDEEPKTPLPRRGASEAVVPEPAKDQFASVAAKIVMKIMYVARYCRQDLLRAVGILASQISVWTTESDKKLTRLIAYMESAKGWRSVAFVGDDLKDTRISLHTDADHAGCKKDKRSTSGVFLALTGPHTSYT